MATQKRSKIKKITQKAFVLLFFVSVLLVTVIAMKFFMTPNLSWRPNIRSLNDLVQLTAIEPHPPALRAVIDLDALAVGHDQGDIAGGTLHGAAPVLDTAVTSGLSGARSSRARHTYSARRHDHAAEYFAMKSRTCGYTCVRQRRPLKMP
jgi:hypothetical protein